MDDTSTEDTVIEYREILRRENNCYFPVHVDIAGVLFEYADRLCSSTIHTYADWRNAADDSSFAYLSQSLLGIKPLLAVIEKCNTNLLAYARNSWLEITRDGSSLSTRVFLNDDFTWHSKAWN